MRPADTVARLGGDEFVIVCEDIDESTAIALGHRLTEAIHEPLDIEGIDHRLSAQHRDRAGRGGPPRPGRAAGRRRRRRLPRQGRGPRARRGLRHAACAVSARAAAHGRRAGARALARAAAARLPADRAARGRRSRRSRGAAALGQPGGVMSAPADFIPVAEESALIVEIGAWTLMQACHESAAGYGVGEDGPTVGVNLSRRQLAQPDLPALVADCLRSSGLPAGALRLEVKEAVLPARRRPRADNLETLRDGGRRARPRRLRHRLLLAARPAGRGGQDRPLVHRPARAERRRHGDRRRDRLARPRARHRRDRRGRRERGTGRSCCAARLPAGAGLPVRCPRRPDNLRSVTTFEELDALIVPRAARPRGQARGAPARRPVLLAAAAGGHRRRRRRGRPSSAATSRSRTGAARCSTCCATTTTRSTPAGRSTSTTCSNTRDSAY